MSSWLRRVVITATGLILLTELLVFIYILFTLPPGPGYQYPLVVQAAASVIALNFAWPFFLPFVLLCSIAFVLSAAMWSILYMLGKGRH